MRVLRGRLRWVRVLAFPRIPVRVVGAVASSGGILRARHRKVLNFANGDNGSE